MTTHDVSLGATAQRALTYDKITSVHESENFIVLRLDKRQVMSILKTGFIKGSLEDFRTFIMRKIHEAEEGYENVDIDTGDVEEDRDAEPVYTPPQEVEDVIGGEEGISTDTVAEAEKHFEDNQIKEDISDVTDAIDSVDEEEADPYKAMDAFRKKD